MACQQMLDPQSIAMAAKGALARKGYRRKRRNCTECAASRKKKQALKPEEKAYRQAWTQKNMLKAKRERRYMDFLS